MTLLSKEILAVAFGGAFGSVARLLLSRTVQLLIPYAELPWGIIAVNILGCFIIGFLYVFFHTHWLSNTLWRTGLIVGVLGGFTTFSSFTLDTVVFLQKTEYFAAASNIFLSVTLCLLATLVGIWTASLFILEKI